MTFLHPKTAAKRKLVNIAQRYSSMRCIMVRAVGWVYSYASYLRVRTGCVKQLPGTCWRPYIYEDLSPPTGTLTFNVLERPLL